MMYGPKSHPVIAKSGGARKLRFSPPDWRMGKSGALRVIYMYFREFGVIWLGAVYPKGVQDNLTNDQLKALARELKEIQAELSREV